MDLNTEGFLTVYRRNVTKLLRIRCGNETNKCI